MKRHRKNNSNLPSRSRCLGVTCGTNIDTEGIDFTDKQSNLVYMDKVFSFNDDTSSPLLFNLNTGGMNTNNFIVELTLKNCGTSLIPCTLSRNAVFTIDNSFVVVEYFNTRPPGNINASQVTVDGFNVDSVSYSNGQYTAKTANALPRVQKDRCLDEGLPTKVFFLIENAGPWDFRATYVLEGTVNTDGRMCCFRAEITNSPNSSNTSLPPGSLSSFAIPDLSLPCSINGIAPDILFQFTAEINLVNPRLVVNCATPALVAGASDQRKVHSDKRDECSDKHHDCCCPDIIAVSSESCTVSLVTSLAIEPRVHVETLRKTLFCVNACEGLQPCQGSVRAVEEEEEEEECEVQGSPCRCNSNDDVGGVTTRDRDHGCNRDRDCDRDRDKDRDDVLGIIDCIRDDVRGIIDRNKDRDRDDDVRGIRVRDRARETCNTNFEMPCGNRNIGGVTVGVGTCDDCNDGRNRGRNDAVRGIRDSIRDRRKDHGSDVLGDRFCREELLSDLIEELLGERDCDCDVAGVGLGTDGTFGCDCEEVRGTRDRDKDDVRGIRDRDKDDVRGIRDRDKDDVRGISRTAFQYNGCNGCSW